MKTMKKLVCLFLCAVLTLGFAGAAFAEGAVETPTVPANEEMTIFDTAALEKIVTEYCAEKGLNSANISIAYRYTGTGESWYYNADTWLYAASTYKLPLMMLCAEKIAVGSMNKDTRVDDITLEDAMQRILTKDNDGYARVIRNMLGGDEAWRESTKKFSPLNDGYYNADFVSYYYVTARYMLDVLNTLYANPASYPGVLENMKQCNPGGYMNKNLADYDVAQIWGYLQEASGKINNHAAGVIYTPTPILITIMTKNIGASDAVIAALSAEIAEYSVTLDGRVNTYLVEKAEAEQKAAEAAAEAQAAAEAAAAAAAEAAAQETPKPAASSSGAKNTESKGGALVYILIALVVIAAAAAALVYLRKRVYDAPETGAKARRGSAKPRRGFSLEEDEDDDMTIAGEELPDDEEEEEAPKTSGRVRKAAGFFAGIGGKLQDAVNGVKESVQRGAQTIEEDLEDETDGEPEAMPEENLGGDVYEEAAVAQTPAETAVPAAEYDTSALPESYSLDDILAEFK